MENHRIFHGGGNSEIVPLSPLISQMSLHIRVFFPVQVKTYSNETDETTDFIAMEHKGSL